MAKKYVVTQVTQIFEITQGKFHVQLKMDKDHIHLGNEFVFKSTNTPETLKRWRNVLELLGEAIKVAEHNMIDVKGGEKHGKND